MNLLQEMVLKNVRKGENVAAAGGLTSAQKKKMEEMKKLDIQTSTPRETTYKSAVIAKSGPGGVIFDFGDKTGNPMADNFSELLNQFSEPAQTAVANFQAKQMSKSLYDYVEMGEHKYTDHVMKKSEPDEYADKSTDDIIKALAEKGELDCSEHGSGPGIHVKGDFNKSRMQLNGEEIVAQSETDAAVLDMHKGMFPSQNQIDSMSADDIDRMLQNPK